VIARALNEVKVCDNNFENSTYLWKDSYLGSRSASNPMSRP
jgi:hypothetical protein